MNNYQHSSNFYFPYPNLQHQQGGNVQSFIQNHLMPNNMPRMPNNIPNNMPNNMSNNMPNNMPSMPNNMPNNMIPYNQPVTERRQASRILDEMVSRHKFKKKRNNIENKVSQYLLLFSVDIDFRKYICNLIQELYNTKVTSERVNEKTIRFLVIHHSPIMEEVFKSYGSNKGIFN